MNMDKHKSYKINDVINNSEDLNLHQIKAKQLPSASFNAYSIVPRSFRFLLSFTFNPPLSLDKF